MLALSIEIDREEIGAAEVAVAATFRTMLAYLPRLVEDESEACGGCKTISKEIFSVYKAQSRAFRYERVVAGTN